MDDRWIMSRPAGMCATIVMATLFGPFVCSCRFGGEDSWMHYQKGGMFVTTTPSLSADGQQLAYASPFTGCGDVYVIQNGSKVATRLTSGEAFEASPLFSPDGKRIAFVRERAGRRHIWMIERDGSNETQLTDGDFIDDVQSFSSDGRYLLFYRSGLSTGFGREGWSYVMCVDTSERLPMRFGGVAVFAPDAESVVFSEDYNQLQQYQLRARTTSSFPGRGWPLGFSPDGRYLLTARSRNLADSRLEYEFWVRDVKSRDEKQVASGSRAILFGDASCRVLFFKKFEHVPYVTTLDGETPVRVACQRGYKSDPRVHTTGGVLLGVYSGTEMRDVIYVAPDTLSASVIASLGRGGCWFNSPLTTDAHRERVGTANQSEGESERRRDGENADERGGRP